MGLYDYIDFKMTCPNCGAMVEEWQSKDREDRRMNLLKFNQVENFYGSCTQCGLCVEFTQASRWIWHMSLDKGGQ